MEYSHTPFGWNAKCRAHRPEACTRTVSQPNSGAGYLPGGIPDVNPVLSRIRAHDPLIRGVRLHLVRMTIRPFMSAERKTPRRRVGGSRRSNVIDRLHLKYRRPEPPI